MAVRTDQRIGVSYLCAVVRRQMHHIRQVFQIHLMHNAGCRRHHAEVVEGFLAPLEELIPLTISLELPLRVVVQGKHAAKLVHLHAVVHHQVHRGQRIHRRRVAAHARYRAPHRSQVNNARYPREVLQNHASGLERDLDLACRLRPPLRDGLYRLARDLEAVLLTKSRLKQHPDGKRQPGDLRNSLLLQRCKAE